MRYAIIVNTDAFRVDSYGNGTAYRLADKASMHDVFFQGDDASVFRDEWRALETVRPEWSQDQVLGELWAIYESVSQPVQAECERHV